MRQIVLALGMVSGLGACASACGDSTRSYRSETAGAGGLVGSGGGGAGGAAANCLPLAATGCSSSCCEAGLTCIQDQCVQNTCMGDTTACSGTAQCCSATVHKCLLGQCGPAACRQRGETCTEDFTCCADSYCATNSRCVARPDVGSGCSDTVPCRSGLRCNGTTGKCESCSSDAGIIACLVALPRCGLAVIGTACTQPSDCCSSNCVAGYCAAVCFELGQVCSQDSECCSGQCRQNLCVYTACQPTGASCTTNGNCCSNHCVTGSKCQ
jgi:hypothetical protein